MIMFITLCYASFYFLFFGRGWIGKTPRNISIFIGVGVVIVGSIVFCWYTFAPIAKDARVFRYIIPITPNVKGQVIEVAISEMQRVKKGDTLYRIDPTQFEYRVLDLKAQVDKLKADLELVQANLKRAQQLLKVRSAAQVDVDTWTAKVKSTQAAIASTEAQLELARWRLAETHVLAPADGYSPSVQIRPGHMVTASPRDSSLPFISTEQTYILASFSQSAIRRIEPGNPVEINFAHKPGTVYTGTVDSVIEAAADSQVHPSSKLPAVTGQPASGRWVALILLDDAEVADALPQGAGGSLAVYTNGGKLFHVISKVVIRINAWLGYLTAP